MRIDGMALYAIRPDFGTIRTEFEPSGFTPTVANRASARPVSRSRWGRAPQGSPAADTPAGPDTLPADWRNRNSRARRGSCNSRLLKCGLADGLRTSASWLAPRQVSVAATSWSAGSMRGSPRSPRRERKWAAKNRLALPRQNRFTASATELPGYASVRRRLTSAQSISSPKPGASARFTMPSFTTVPPRWMA